MKQYLLSGLCAAMLSTAPAAVAQGTSARAVKSAYRMEEAAAQGPLKRLNHTVRFNNIVNPIMAKGMHKAANAGITEVVLNESFEGNRGKLPEGWSIESKGSADLLDIEKWSIGKAWSAYVPTPADGEYYAYMYYSSKHQDEWLISPQMDLGNADYELNFMAYLNCGFFYIVDKDHV